MRSSCITPRPSTSTPDDLSQPQAAVTGLRSDKCTEAVLFDMDGLLVDSEPLWTIAEEELSERLGGTWDDVIKAEVVGTRLDVSVPRIVRYFGVEPTDSAVEEARHFLMARMVELYATELPVHEGALELLDALNERGVPTALVSSSYRELVDAALSALAGHEFKLTLAGDEVQHGKPDPEPYLKACATLGVEPARTVVLEDARSGVQSAEAAGCAVLVVPFVAPIEPAPRRWVVRTLAGIDVDWLLSLPCL
jgi:HAD superfamily hydrolase (TIGR01509 family)